MIASAGLRNWPPALLTSVSIRPWRSSTPSKNESTPSSSRMSRPRDSKLPARPSASAAVSSSGSVRRPQPTTVAPSRTISRAVARPSPDPAPDTTMTRPSSRPSRKISDRKDSPIAGREPYRGGPPHIGSGHERPCRPETPRDTDFRRAVEGATVTVEPIVTGRLPLAGDPSVESRRGGRQAQGAAVGRAGESADSDTGLPDPPPEGRADPGRHRPPPFDRQRSRPRTSAGSAPGSASRRLEPGRTCPHSCATAGIAPSSIRLVLLTHLHLDHASGDRRLPRGDLRRLGGRVEGRRPPGCSRCSRATDASSTTTPSTSGPLASTEKASLPTRPSAARSTSSATARSASPRPPATRAGHQSVIVRLKDRDMVIGGDAIYREGAARTACRPAGP